ncbi:MAG: hypothetical protein IT223_00510 [Crocinitomicaceae bacterium]|nr:hypothetical protein [Crocinitomicaceae bacterium]
MRNYALFSFFFLLLKNSLPAQFVPDAISYQAVARNVGGNEIVNQSLTVKIGITEDTAEGLLIYEEIHDVVTNSFGLFSLEIGRGLVSGNSLFDSLTELDWHTHKHFLRIEIDTPEPGGFEFLGATELIAVPYAFHSHTADSAPEIDGDEHNELISGITVSGTDILFEEGGNTTSLDASGIAYKTWQENGSGIYHDASRVAIGTQQPKSSLHVQGSYSSAIATFIAVNDGATDNFSLDESHQVLICNVTDGDMNILLPSAIAASGRIYQFRRYFSGQGNYAVTLIGNSGQTIDGAAQKVFNSPMNEYMTVISDGANWYVIAHSAEQP